MNGKPIAPFEPGTPVILVNGDYPGTDTAGRYLLESEYIICCDGAANTLVNAGLNPALIIGDMDSITPGLKVAMADRLVEISDQETNDLSKALSWSLDHDITRLVVLGATGKRLDHTLANTSLIGEYAIHLELMMVMDDGIIMPVTTTSTFQCLPGQQVSLFSLSPETRFSSHGLKYPLKTSTLPSLWSGSLNEALGNTFTLEFDVGIALVYMSFLND
jgi:thiamine pyrophosphokinase